MRRWTPPEDMPPLRSNSPGELELERGGSGSSSGSPRTATMRDGGGNGKDKDKRGDAEQEGAEGAEAAYTPRPVPRLMRPPPKSPLRGKADKVENSAVGNLLSWARSAAAPRSAGALSAALGLANARQEDDDEEDEDEEDEDFSELPGALALRGRPSFADSTRASIGDASVRDMDGADFRNAIQHHQRDSPHSGPSHNRDIHPQFQLQQQHSTTSTGTHTTSRSSSSPQQFGPPGFHFPARNVRQSVASSALSADTEATTATTSAVSSLLDGFGGGGRSSGGGYVGGYGGGSGGNNYGTIRTVTTEMTSEAPSMSRAEGNSIPEEVKRKRSGMEMGGNGDSNNSACGGGAGGSASTILGMSGSPGGAKAMYGLGRERKMSGAPMPDLSRVAEETDESVSSKGHHTTSRGDRDRARDRERSSAQQHHRQLQSQSPHNRAEKQSSQVHLRKGKWPDDFVDAFHAPSPSQPVPLKRTLTDNMRYGGGGEDEGRQRGTPPLSISPPRKLAIVGARRGDGDGLGPLPRRPTHRPRHSLDSSPGLLPKDALLRREASPDSTSSGSRVVLRRHSTKPGIVAGRQGAYSPLANGSDNASSPDSDGPSAAAGPTAAGATAPAPVPFPRSVPHTGTPSPQSSTGLDNMLPSDRPRLLRGRFQSDVEGSARSQARPNSYDELGARPPRSRFESMVNLGGSSAQASASDLLARDSMDGSAVRMRLIVREDGKPPTHFQLGNCIGKGQFGSVYRALNLNTGQMVAVKRIRLEGLKEEEVTTLMREVDLVKSLSHPSIVKYEGMARDDDTLNIVLEFAENGSLGQTIKAFGKLNERLVASYVVKILEGLHYLHTSDVVHCDLKAANILTTKNGNVKLSDFGVSLNLRAMEREKDVAGTPNWMAPEVIELKGASTKSDIWSLGCTVIELLTGRPPYAEISNAMTVMFRIVEDDMPPIPEDASDPLKDFLEQCFHKDPTRRPSAEELCEHAWLKNTWVALKDLRPQDSIPFLRRVSTDLHKSEVVRYLSQLDIPDSPISGSPKRLEGGKISPVARRTSAASVRPLENDFAPRDHTFVKTTFSKPVICRVCQLTVKKTAVLCSQCSLISHAKCQDNAPPTCDLRAHLLLYAQYAEKGNPASAYSNPSNEVGQQVAMSDIAFVEHNTPRTSIDSPQPPRSPAFANNIDHPPTAFKFMAAFRRSRTSLTPEPATPVVSPSSPATPPPPKDVADVPPARRRPAVLQKRSERPLSMTSDSTGLSSLRSAATAAESFSSRQNTGQRSQLSGGGRPVSDGAALDSRTRSSKITSSGRSEAPTEADRDNLGLPGSLPTNVGTRKKHKAKAASSGNCLVQ
ncbi:hypothetical protein BJ912DRAFT_431034 [Pholiota molesta]|nr:hypothetical protein BJ912DRAFT_431034 [Pholiota molesta]